MAADLTITGIQAIRLPHRARSGYRVKSSTSFVDETLFGSPSRSGHVSVPHFDPPWAEKVNQQRPLMWSPQTSNSIKDHNASKDPSRVSTPRKYRLKNRFPSYCDETLFCLRKEEPDCEAPWAKQETKPRLRPLFWVPFSTPKLQSNHPVHLKQLPLKAIHSQTPMPNLSDFQLDYHKTADCGQQPESALDSRSMILECRRSKSLNPLQKEKSSTAQPSSNHRPPMRVRSSSFSESKCLTRAVPVNTGKPRPPWK